MTASAISRSAAATTTRPRPASRRPAPDLNDHRRAADVGQRLSRQTGRGHAGGNHNQRIAGHRHSSIASSFPVTRPARPAGFVQPFRCGGSPQFLPVSGTRGALSGERTYTACGAGAEAANLRANYAGAPRLSGVFLASPPLFYLTEFRAEREPMDSFELNKVAGAVLFSLLVILGVKNLAAELYKIEPANPKSFVVEGVVPEGGEAAAPAAAAPEVRCRCCWPRPTRPPAKSNRRSAAPATTSLKAPAPRSARTFTASSAVRAPAPLASPIRKP